MQQITIDKDIVDFLRFVYLGSSSCPYKAASKRAYLDLNRTIQFDGMEKCNRVKLRNQTDDLLKSEIAMLVVDGREGYDLWHFIICDAIRKKYRDAGVKFTFGQAQKWVNMTMKYLYIIGKLDFSSILKYAHVPLDKNVFSKAKGLLGIDHPKKSWSKWDDYTNEYMCYQKSIRERVTVEPLRWELQAWLDEAKNNQN